MLVAAPLRRPLQQTAPSPRGLHQARPAAISIRRLRCNTSHRKVSSQQAAAASGAMAPAFQPARIQAPEAPREGAPSALVVVFPGAMLGPKDYDALLGAIKGLPSSTLDLWVAVVPVDWGHLMGLGLDAQDKWLAYSDGLIRDAVREAGQQGFQLVGKPEARMENVFVGLHSVAGAFYPGVPMKHCAGAVMLASAIDGTTTNGATPDAAAAPGPLLHVLGAMDGQMRLPRAAWVAAHLAPLAAQFGAGHFARVRPFAVVPGMNHAHFSNGVVNTARGDIASDVPIETQAAAVAGLVAAFAAANHPNATEESTRHEIDQLLQATTASFDLLTPFLQASGRGSPSTLLAAGAAGTLAAAEEVQARCFGAERLPPMAPGRNSFSHAGELEAAERFCRAAQRRMLAAGLPPGGVGPAELAGCVRIAVTSHTHLDTFIYSQPTVFQTETPAGKQWVVSAHVYLHWECYQPGGMETMLKPLSPLYFLKLKKGAVLARLMDLEGGTEGVVSAAEINADTLQEALAAAPPLLKETFQQRGKQLQFAPDRDVSKEISSPVDWMGMPPTFEPGPTPACLVMTSPCVSTPATPLPAYDRGPGRMTGNHYLKVCSPAWMHEWVMVEGLRR